MKNTWSFDYILLGSYYNSVHVALHYVYWHDHMYYTVDFCRTTYDFMNNIVFVDNLANVPIEFYIHSITKNLWNMIFPWTLPHYPIPHLVLELGYICSITEKCFTNVVISGTAWSSTRTSMPSSMMPLMNTCAVETLLWLPTSWGWLLQTCRKRTHKPGALGFSSSSR